jgi:hypothetical protein
MPRAWLGPGRRGVIEELGLEGRVEVPMGTLGKALGSAGGFVTGSTALIEFLLNRARSFVFSTAPPPAVAAAATAAVGLVRGATGAELVARFECECRPVAPGFVWPGMDPSGPRFSHSTAAHRRGGNRGAGGWGVAGRGFSGAGHPLSDRGARAGAAAGDGECSARSGGSGCVSRRAAQSSGPDGASARLTMHPSHNWTGALSGIRSPRCRTGCGRSRW